MGVSVILHMNCAKRGLLPSSPGYLSALTMATYIFGGEITWVLLRV